MLSAELELIYKVAPTKIPISGGERLLYLISIEHSEIDNLKNGRSVVLRRYGFSDRSSIAGHLQKI